METKTIKDYDRIAQLKEELQESINRIKNRRRKNETKVKCQIATAILDHMQINPYSQTLDDSESVKLFFNFIDQVIISQINNNDYSLELLNYIRIKNHNVDDNDDKDINNAIQTD